MLRKQIQIIIKDIPNDRRWVEEILSATADKFSLFENTLTSTVPDTIRSFLEGRGNGLVSGYGFGLGARLKDKLIIIDFNPRGNNLEKFDAVYQFIVSKIISKFFEGIREFNENNSEYIGI